MGEDRVVAGERSDAIPGADCVFCQIVSDDANGQIECAVGDSIVITPLNPVVSGHKLVIPSKHVADAAQDPEVTGCAMRDAAVYMQRMGMGDCNVITSRGAAATQTVAHLHIHLVPRREGDGLSLPWSAAAAPLLPGGEEVTVVERDAPLLEVVRGPYAKALRHIADLEAEVERLRSLLPGGGEAETVKVYARGPQDDDAEKMDALGSYLEKYPPSGFADRYSADGWRHIARGVLSAAAIFFAARPDAEQAPQEGDVPEGCEVTSFSPPCQRGTPGCGVPHDPRPQGDEVETVARALAGDDNGPWYAFEEDAERVLAALDARSGADTVKLADVERWLHERARRTHGNGASSALYAAARDLLAEFGSGADRPEGSQAE